MKQCKDCKWSTHWWAIECAIRDFWGKQHECIYYARKWWKFWVPKLILTIALLLALTGCSRTTATYKDGVATVTRTRLLMTEDIDSFSYDASDGSFTFEGYKSDMTRALILLDKLTAEDEERRLIAREEVKP